MLNIIGGLFIAVLVAGGARAQTSQQGSGVPTPRYAPFASDWAKPFPETGGYFYNDPRFQYYNQPLRPGTRYTCPAGSVLNPSTRSCY